VLVIEDATTRGQRMAVKAASTAAAASDPSAVVALSPNSPLPAGTNVIGALSANQSVNLNQVAGAAVAAGHGTAAGSLRVELPTDGTGVVGLNAGSNVIGKVGIDQTTPGTTNALQGIPGTSGGLSASKTISAASTNATSVKGSAGQVYSIYAHNLNAAVRYLKLYNKASAPTVGTDTPLLTLPIPGNTAGAGFVLDTGGMGIAFSTGIAFALTTGVADADTGAVAANDIVANILYK
jgi:hypothetical protein